MKVTCHSGFQLSSSLPVSLSSHTEEQHPVSHTDKAADVTGSGHNGYDYFKLDKTSIKHSIPQELLLSVRGVDIFIPGNNNRK